MEARGWRAIGDPRDHRLDAWPGPEPLHRPAHGCRRARRASPCGPAGWRPPRTPTRCRAGPAGSTSTASGVFTTQKTWLWCTAADVQIIRNIADHATDHSRSSQQRYFDYMRAHNRYAIPVSDGVDPAGWTAGLRRLRRQPIPARRAAAASTRPSARRSRTCAGPTCRSGSRSSHGNHAWVLTGFTATADPADDDPVHASRACASSGRCGASRAGATATTCGPTRSSRRPSSGASSRPWHYAGVRMAWEGKWVSVQPVAKAARPAPATPRPAARAHRQADATTDRRGRRRARPRPRSRARPLSSRRPRARRSSTRWRARRDPSRARIQSPRQRRQRHPLRPAMVSRRPSWPARPLALVSLSVVAAGGTRRVRQRR